MAAGDIGSSRRKSVPAAESEKWQPEVPAVKELYTSIPCFRSRIKRDLKLQDRILLILKDLSGKAESGFRDGDVTKFNKLAYPDSESADRNKPPLTTSELRVLPVRQQISLKDDLLKKYFFPVPDENSWDNDIKIISIMGSGKGSGKTTVAQMVYNDERVRDSFQVRKWVFVGNSFNYRKCMDRVRREVVGAEEDVDVDDDVVANFLSGKRFLLVFDHLCEEVDYTFCWPPLNYGAPGSIILLTTNVRIRTRHIEVLGALSDSDGWSIFKQTALSGKPELRRKVRGIGRQLARQCWIPLAAKTLGDYLKSKETAQEWEDALRDETWPLEIKGALSRLRDPGRFENYELLSPQLKECFVYFAAFPKDACINVDMLVALWAAMGCIGDTTDTVLLEKRGHDVLTALEKGFNMLYGGDFTRSIHKDKITSFKFSKVESVYYVAQYARPDLTMLEQNKKLFSETQSLRSFVIVSHCELPKDLFTRLKHVKALVLSACKLEQLSDEVGSLDLLKFLDLSGNPLKRLPETIGDLKCLQSLYLHSCYLLLSIPGTIGDLENLGNLRINYTTDELHKLPQGFEKLTSIRTLDVFRIGGTYDNIGLLKKLNHLVDIRITVHGVVCFSDADLESKIEMENLELCFVGKGRDREIEPCVEKLVPPPNLEMLLIEDYHGLILPMWILINSLKRLSLRSAVNIISLPPLWKLSNLEFLWIFDMPNIRHLGREFFGLNISRYDEDSSEDEDGHSAITAGGNDEREEEAAAFRSLKMLRIEYMQNLETWEDVDIYGKQIKVMPSLDSLIISGCPKLQEWPLRILRDTPWFKK